MILVYDGPAETRAALEAARAEAIAIHPANGPRRERLADVIDLAARRVVCQPRQVKGKA